MSPVGRAALPLTVVLAAVAGFVLRAAVAAAPPPAQVGDGKSLYEAVKAFPLTGGSAAVSGLALKRDRVEMTFTGTFYFAAPAAGRVTGAVFIGDGTVRAEVPPSDFERDNLRRMIGADILESDFKTLVLRWSDDTFDAIGASHKEGGDAPAQAARLAAESDAKLLLETGANMSSRIATSLINGETPGVFMAQFDGGRRGKFTYLLDHQGRIPVGSFRLNGGEKGLIFAWQSAYSINDIWMAFYSAEDYARRVVEYSDAQDLVDVKHYRLNLDLRELARRIGVVARIEMEVRADGVRAIPFKVGESLPVSQDMRLKNQLRVKDARAGDQALTFVQEDWEGGFTVFLPQPAARGQSLVMEISLDGDFMQDVPIIPGCFYPYDNVTWLPRHGYLDRATFDSTVLPRRRDRVASIGTRSGEVADPQDPEVMTTRYQMTQPVALAVFAVGPFERRTQQVTWESGTPPTPLEFNSVPARVTMNARAQAINHEFLLAELDNAVRYFSALFGRYPYETFGAAFHPYNFGQGFPSLLMIPPTDSESRYTHAFIAHETAHQWWGNIVAWRSYRDQWLSEGFAEYSGLLYTAKRDREGVKALMEMLKAMRESLVNPPRTALGVGKGRLNDIGPLILGLRLNTSKSVGAYQGLIYEKGALVLRMLHFLFSNPANGDDSVFLTMMKDFVEKHRNGAARTEDFRAVASQHIGRTPIGQKFAIRDLDWFFRQWVYGTELPTYTLEYEFKPNQDGSVNIAGVVRQDGVGPNWFMVLPVTFSFDGNQEARTTVRAAGPSTPFELKLPARPRKVELDPQLWVVSEKTITRGR